jgi:hypothetical protein
MRVTRKSLVSLCIVMLLSLFGIFHGTLARAQTRISDKDLETLMRNLRDDVRSFRPRFDSAVRKSAIHKTSEEKGAKNLVARFEKQTKTMLNSFKKTKNREDISDVFMTADQIDKLVYDLKLDFQTASSWQNVRGELSQLSSAFGLSEHDSRTVTTTVVNSKAPPCVQAVGVKRSTRLVDECLQVSPATNSPCNAQNSCILIIDEIKRSCAFLQSGAPEFCSKYK